MRVPIYRSHLHIGIGASSEECVAALPAHVRPHVQKLLPADNAWDGYTFDIEDGHFVVLLRVDPASGDVPVDAIFHEVGHVSAWICHYHQVRICPKDHEAYAHLQGWVGKEVTKRLRTYYGRHRKLKPGLSRVLAK